jgi:hypothetical protein
VTIGVESERTDEVVNGVIGISRSRRVVEVAPGESPNGQILVVRQLASRGQPSAESP